MGKKRLAEQSSLVKLPFHIIKKLGPESLEQISVMEYLRYKYPQAEKVTFHVANERKQNKIWGLVMSHMGLKAGIPDIMMPIARKGYHGLFIEMKSKKGRLSDNQIRMIELLANQNYLVKVAYGCEQAIKAINSYLD